MISKSRRDSGGGGGGSRIFFPGSPKADAIQWGGVPEFFRDLRDQTTFGGGGGVVTEMFSYLQLQNHIFTPHRVIFLGRDTHFLLDTAKIRISCWKKITQIYTIP